MGIICDGQIQMILLDANYILRFLLKDNLEMYETSKVCITNNQCKVLHEVFAEVVFVLLKVYSIDRYVIKNTLLTFLNFDNVIIDDELDIAKALEIFENKNLDFVDAILCAKSNKYQIKTFDKKLIKCIDSIS